MKNISNLPEIEKEFLFVSLSNQSVPEALHSEWETLLDSSNNVNILYQSPKWFEHLSKTEVYENLHLLVLKTYQNKVIGVVPILIGNYY